ncbi:MAG: hypothetical protein RL687_509 [Candidatus Parcubacteria bacterium]
MREIEVKAKIKDKGKLLKKLAELGFVFDSEKHQHDRVYFPNGVEFTGGNIIGQNVLRIRTEEKNGNKKSMFALKYSASEALDKIEKEFEITDTDQMHEVILMLGHYLFIEIKKHRMTGKYKDYEICIDEVEDLGSFIEVEKIVEEDVAGDQILIELDEFLNNLNIDQSDKTIHGYDILMGNLKKKHTNLRQ